MNALTNMTPAVEMQAGAQRGGGFERSTAAIGPDAFSSALSEAMSRDDVDARRELLREAASDMVASAFIVPVLATLRESSLAEGPFAPNIAEKRFGPLFDQHIADRITKAANFSLVDTIVDRYLPKAAERIEA